MSSGSISNLYVIGRYLFSSFLTENFRNTDVYKSYILNQTFTKEITSGSLDLSNFTNSSETFKVKNLIFKLKPRNTSDIEIELKYNGTVTFNKASSSNNYYSSFSASLNPTCQITDTTNGGDSLLTDFLTFDQINISGTGFFETIDDLIFIGLNSSDVNLRFDSLNFDFTNTDNQSTQINFDAQSANNYTVTKTIDGTLVETSSVDGMDDGNASFSISGTVEAGQTLSVSTDTADPDGTGTLSYSWQTSSDNSTWSEVGTSATYTV